MTPEEQTELAQLKASERKQSNDHMAPPELLLVELRRRKANRVPTAPSLVDEQGNPL
jgi:hypothetical protein